MDRVDGRWSMVDGRWSMVPDSSGQADGQGRRARPYHLEQIAAFCAEYPIEPKILFVPSRQVGANLLTALARSGCDWINLEPLTPANHAEQETAPQLRTSGLKSLHTDTAHVMV
ncbi:MAG: hypothetical protein ACC655_08690, partial [Rhodothermia bacterium]